MGSFFIRLEKPPPGLNHARQVSGQAAVKNWKKLTLIAQELNVKPLQYFVVEDNGTGPVKEKWFPPTEALITIRKLISAIVSHKTAYADVRLLIRDLNDYENILSAADARRSRFYFAASFESTPEPEKT